jgi:hypothetical protein
MFLSTNHQPGSNILCLLVVLLILPCIFGHGIHNVQHCMFLLLRMRCCSVLLESDHSERWVFCIFMDYLPTLFASNLNYL